MTWPLRTAKEIKTWEDEKLHPCALKSSNGAATKREYPEEKEKIEDVFRTPFQHDRDRILHCTALKRLMHKTQVLIQPPNEEFRCRLTHTLEVMQIARAIARALYLNEDATEAMALGHDLGHTPFGHAGEEALRSIMNEFEHHDQSIRVVDLIETTYVKGLMTQEGVDTVLELKRKLPKNAKESVEKLLKDKPSGHFGLNLTYEVRKGIYKHSLKQGKGKDEKYGMYDDKFPGTSLEAQVVALADRLAYSSHDLDDLKTFKIIREKDLEKYFGDNSVAKKLSGETHRDRLRELIQDVIGASYKEIKDKKNNISGNEIKYSPEYMEVMEGEKSFYKYFEENVWYHPFLERKAAKAKECILTIFSFFEKLLYEEYWDMPEYLKNDHLLKGACKHEQARRIACDLVAKLTDEQALYFYEGLNSVHSFRGWTGTFGTFIPSRP